MTVTGTVGPVEHCCNANQCVGLSLNPLWAEQRPGLAAATDIKLTFLHNPEVWHSLLPVYLSP